MADIPTTVRSKGALAQWAADTYGVSLDTTRTRRQMEEDLDAALMLEAEIARDPEPEASEPEPEEPEAPRDCGADAHTAPRVHSGRFFCTTCGQLVVVN